MGNSLFFVQSDLRNSANSNFLDRLAEYSEQSRTQMYIVRSPLGEERYNSYEYEYGLLVLSPKHNLVFVDCGGGGEDFEIYCDDFIDDISSISDKFKYKEHIGRQRVWERLIRREAAIPDDLHAFFEAHEINNLSDGKICELLISLVTGSINDIDRVRGDVPVDLLDKIKRKIQLFDGDQTRFIYQKSEDKRIVIQGLSGTGKTELLLHKLKELYVSNEGSKIMFTCHNKILAANLKKRIPEFFNFMKVEQQIAWEERLWCVHAWGSQSNINSGAYRYICGYYGAPFFSFNRTSMTFDDACHRTYDYISSLKDSDADFHFAFDFVFVDESQDFPDSFFKLCELVSKRGVYIAGDVFQNIFGSTGVDKVAPTYLLSRCYRTDPKTLMFSHGLGMGLFETPNLRWLKDEEWEHCGYKFTKEPVGEDIYYKFTREPLRRFEDLENYESTSLVKVGLDFANGAVSEVVNIVGDLILKYSSIQPDDIAIIFLDGDGDTYLMADMLSAKIKMVYGWDVNQSYVSKQKISGQVFVSNINNVKGLEFPFVICVTKRIKKERKYRNALYVMMTRSFIKSYLVLSNSYNAEIIPNLEAGLSKINGEGMMFVKQPSPADLAMQQQVIDLIEEKKPLKDMTMEICRAKGWKDVEIFSLLETVESVFKNGYERDVLEDYIATNSRFYQRSIFD